MKATVVIRLSMAALLIAIAAPVSAGDQESRVASWLQFTRGASDAAGIGKLASSPLPHGQQEIRIWVGFGVLRVDHMLRLQVKPSGEVRGELLAHYKNDLSDMNPEDAAEFRRNVLAGCKDLRVGAEEDVCTVTFDRQPNWRSIYRKLVDNGLLDLPDQSTLPPPEIEINDGSAIIVELRNGLQYRAYQYNNPGFRSEAQAVSAQKIMQIIGTTFRDSNAAF